MKEIGKLKKIYEGFFGEKLPEEIIEKRREQCKNCEFNSTNTKNLTGIDSLRKDFVKEPFCVLCKCQIKEKTQSPLEECALHLINEPKKWFKIKIETMENKNLDLVQIGTEKYDIGLDEESFVVKLGNVKNSSEPEGTFIFEAKEGRKLELEKFYQSCGCLSVKSKQVDNKIEVSFKLDVSLVSFGAGSKILTLLYFLDGVKRIQKLHIKYFREA